jgi:hypothetical protein
MTIFYTILYYLHVVQFYYFGLLNKKMVATQAPPSFYFYSVITGNIIGT